MSMTDQGCSDGGCDLRDRRGGQHTNGGCHCLDALDGETRFRLRRYMRHTRESRDSLATQLEQMRRERDEARADRDSVAQALGETRADLAEARATNTKLHRRAQGVEAGKPEDEETIRRLRAEVVAITKHAKCVADRDRSLRDALSVANHMVVTRTSERDEARAKLARVRDETVRLIRDQCECMTCYQHRGVLRIIDEKEGGQ